MQIPSDIALWLQNALRDLIRDDWSCGRMCLWRNMHQNFPGNFRDPILISDWQTSVDSICRCFASGLIAMTKDSHYSNQSALLDDLQKYNPFDRRPPALSWYGTFIYGTDKLDVLVKQYFQDDDEYAATANHDFVNVIEKAFADAGLPWSGKPLLPISQAATKP
jgi:hypothetical protein